MELDGVLGRFHADVGGEEQPCTISGIGREGVGTMGVAVYPRLGELLRTKNLTMDALEWQIAARYGLMVDPLSLYRLMQGETIQQADLDVAGAAAAVLGVELGDLFDVEAIPLDPDGMAEHDLDPDQGRRLAELLDQQGRRDLSSAEEAELDVLVAETGRRMHEWSLRRIARQRGIPVEQARREVQAEFDEVLAWWRDVHSDPKWRRKVKALAKRGGHGGKPSG